MRDKLQYGKNKKDNLSMFRDRIAVMTVMLSLRVLPV